MSGRVRRNCEPQLYSEGRKQNRDISSFRRTKRHAPKHSPPVTSQVNKWAEARRLPTPRDTRVGGRLRRLPTWLSHIVLRPIWDSSALPPPRLVRPLPSVEEGFGPLEMDFGQVGEANFFNHRGFAWTDRVHYPFSMRPS